MPFSTKRVKIDRSAVNIKTGSFVKYGESVYRVSHMLNFDEIVGVNVNTGEVEVIEIVKAKRVEPETAKNFEHAKKDLFDIHDGEWETIQQRLKAIRPLISGASRKEVEKHAKEMGVHYTTIYRWFRRYLDSGGVMGLLPRKEGYPSGRPRIDTMSDDIIRSVIESYYLTKQRPKIEAVIRKVAAECAKRNVKPPSPGTVRNRIAALNNYEKLTRRHDKSIARDRLSPAAGSFEADYPLQIVQIDHTLADIILVDEKSREPIGRPYLTIAIDVFSRMIVGYHLSFEAPSAVAVAMCIACSVLPKENLLIEKGIEAEWPVWGFMDTLHVDNGADFRSEALVRACLAHNIKLEYRPVGKSNFGGHVERVIGTLMSEVHLLPGTTFSNIKEKGKYDPDARSAMTFSEFEHWLLTFITKVYHKRPHSAIGVSPEKKYKDGIFGTKEHDGIGFPPKPSDPLSVLIDFLPAFKRTIQRNGVNIDNINYYDPVLRQHIKETDPLTGKKRKFLFRRDPRNVSYVWFYDESTQSYFKIPTADQSFPDMSAWELNAAKKLLVQKKERIVDEKAIVSAYEELHAQMLEAAKRTKKKRRQIEKKKANEKHLEMLERSSSLSRTKPSIPLDPEEDIWDGDIPEFEV